MNRLLTSIIAFALAMPCLAATTTVGGVQVSEPIANSTQLTTFSIAATSTTCNAKPTISMGYSIDSSSNTTIVKGASVSASVTTTPGTHTLHVKGWGSGTSCVTDVAFTAEAPAKAVITWLTPAAIDYGTALSAAQLDATANVDGVFTYSPVLGTIPDAGTQVITANFTPSSTTTALSNSAIVSITVNKVTPTVTWTGNIATASVPGTFQYSVDFTPTDTTDYNTVVSQEGSPTVPPVIPPVITGPTIPANAVSVSDIQVLTNWEMNHDPGTPGASTGTSTMVATPSVSGNAREFNWSYTGAGGEIYHISFGDDPNVHNFVYDAYVYLGAGSNNIANLEMDMNQVIANGNTVIFGFQCDGYSKTWDYGDPWVHTSAACDVAKWSTNTWHHIQIAYYRDDSGNLYFQSVWLDGTEQVINGKQAQAKALKWAAGDLLTNFQIDGLGASGSSTVYLDKLTIYRW
jgi:hypothetical protein